MPKKVSPEVFEGFLEEARGYLPSVRGALALFREDTSRKTELAEACRQVHIIKGASSMVGLTALSHIAYEMECTLERLEDGSLVLTDDLAGLLETALDLTAGYLDGAEESGDATFPNFEELSEAFSQIADVQLSGRHGDESAAPAAAELSGQQAAPEAPRTDTISETGPAQVRGTKKKIPQELLDVFTMEAEDHFRTIRKMLAWLDENLHDKTLVQELRRTVHTLKGSAGAVGFEQLATLAHRMEDLLDALYGGALVMDGATQQLLAASADMLEDIAGDSASESVLDDLYAQFASRLQPKAPVAPQSSSERRAGMQDRRGTPRPAQQPSATDDMVRVSQERIDELLKLVGELVINRTTLEQHLGGLADRLELLSGVVDRLRAVSARLETEYELVGMARTLSAAAGGGPPQHDFDELELDRYTEFHHLLRQLSESTSDVKTFNNEIASIMDECETVSTAQAHLSGDIQEKLMGARMVPLATISTRLRQIVRVIAQSQGKLVDLVLEGEHVEIDKKVLDEMVDPLMHVLRNDVDHGIEKPETRLKAGKNERGIIRLRAYYEGSKIVIAISDDGAGLNLERIRETALRNGFASEQDGACLSEEDLYQMIFQPDFSTAESVSEVSGRGVGMDVVKEQVNKLQGSLTLESSPGQGTLLTIRLPMTLSIRRALLVQAWGEEYAVPIGSLKQIVRIPADELPAADAVGEIEFENETYDYVHLGHFMGNAPAARVQKGFVPILIVDAGTRFVALQVDEIMSEREVVVKNLGPHLRRVPGVSGATVLGDGRVMLIVNPLDIALTGDDIPVSPWATVRTYVPRDCDQLTVMAVDDSVSVRQVVSSLITSAGWQPVTASDGIEALETLQRMERKPDIIILDVEMPRMDGYELLARLKGRDLWRHIPVVMLTSRSGEKHRLRALELGAAEYVIKPYQDEMLQNIIRHLASQPRG